jgi:hypothetical protein
MRKGILASFVFACTAALLPAQNMAPVVHAGSDTATRVGILFHFNASALDDGQPNPDLAIEWKQLSGPAPGAEIMVPSAPRTLVNFSIIGNYEFELTANDGALATADTIKVAVEDSISFRVLTPAAGARIELGSTMLVTWQIDPPADVIFDQPTAARST